ncbi:MAG: IPT/TIG domain-containing protein [Spirochaetes bacterium]|nr:IPT/TIG domain-containing protein [Spirochaetota bacterium]
MKKNLGRGAFLLAALFCLPVWQGLHAFSEGGEYFRNPVPRNVASNNSCAVACHFSGTIQKSSTNLFLDGLPATYVPGATYSLTLRVRATVAGRTGFSLTANSATNSMIGAWSLVDPVNTGVRGHSGKGDGLEAAYVSHTTYTNFTNWTVKWTAPPAGQGTATFYASTVLGNGINISGASVYETNWASAEDLTAPTLRSVTPNTLSNQVTSVISIIGSRFASNASVLFGGTAVATTWVNATNLTAVIPFGYAPGAYSLTVTNPASTSVTLDGALTNVAAPIGMQVVKSTINPDAGESCQVLVHVARSGAVIKASALTLLGQPVRAFSVTAAGLWQTVAWNGANDNGVAVPDGVYFLRLQTPDADRLVRVYVVRPR